MKRPKTEIAAAATALAAAGPWSRRPSEILMLSKTRLLTTALIMFVSLVSGCLPSWYAKQADRDAYGAISEGQVAALGKGNGFDITYTPVDCDRYLKRTKDETDRDVDVLTLEGTLKVAFKNSREFQTRKETLYSSALSLANLSRGWESILPNGQVNATAETLRTSGNGPEGGTDSTNRYINADANYSLTRRLVGGGLLALGASMDFASDFLGNDGTRVGSLVEGSFTQPLLRGAWRGLAFEDQHRRERDFLIDVYEFDRFRQTFAVSIMEDYYGVLTLKDQLENSRTNVDRLQTAYLVTQAMVQGGQLTRAQEDQAQQDLLNAQIGMERAILAYSNALDRFKITLGLPISQDLKLDYPGALKRLNRTGPRPLPLAERMATSTSFITDTTLLRARATARDAEKDVEVAADDFNPQLDLELRVSAPGTDRAQPARIQTHHHTRSARLTLNYGLDQTGNRDAYRNAMIARDRSQRGLVEAEDTSTLNVRNSFRSLKQSGRSFDLQKRSVEIAKRRTALVAIQRRQGQATTRDVLEAEAALNASLNGLTTSLVNYTITRLQFLASLGMLSVDPDGTLNERKTPFGYDRLQKRYPYLETGQYDKTRAPGKARRGPAQGDAEQARQDAPGENQDREKKDGQ